ncbi:selenoprotein w [Phaffia rhodozyma]|uniref:Selenoprotein w n=1 Tax=Phaffia rhodozyma TaxID=264483 RepID=A0A0F7SHY7_PHARH|nr:selenoprotein w [Phaffia rhodozyma]
MASSVSTLAADPDCTTGLCPPLKASSLERDQAPSSSTVPATSPVTTTNTSNDNVAMTAEPVKQAESIPESKESDPLLDASTFTPPRLEESEGWRVVIEFCDRCRWLHRATWVQTELFLTFPSPAIRSISLIPLNAPETGGRFRVWVYNKNDQVKLAWDRKIEGGFPELKILKQRVRDIISPAVSLGHSDVHSTKGTKH